MSTNPPPPIRLAIVGGGIGGLALALAITRLNLTDKVQVDIYESAAKLTQIGAGITLWPRGWEIIREWGLEDDLEKYISPGQAIAKHGETRIGFCCRKSDHGTTNTICDVVFRGGSLSFHRADVQSVFLARISSKVQVHLGHRLVSYRDCEHEIELHFRNGQTASCDLLIGADGINSVVRRDFLAHTLHLSQRDALWEAHPLWTGTFVYRSVIDSEVIRKQNPNHECLVKPMIYCGKNRHVVSYPISLGKLVNVVGFDTDPTKEGTFLEGPAVASSTTDIVSALFSDWSEEVKCIINSMERPLRWAIETVKPLDKYGHGKVALLGDAAHAMPTHLGNGAGQAIEDSYILANLILKSSQQGAIDIDKVVRTYNAIRQPFGNFAAKASQEQGRYYDFTAPDFDHVEAGEVVHPDTLELLGKRIAEGFKWTWDSSISNDLTRALQMME